jgi:PAS domain S-box-containing protein
MVTDLKLSAMFQQRLKFMDKEDDLTLTGKYLGLIQLGIILIVAYLGSYYSYLLFHSIAEIISIVVALGIFAVVWNSRHYLNNSYFLLISISFFFVGLIDALHLLAYQGMMDFSHAPGVNLANQLWLVERYMAGTSFFLASFFIGKRLRDKKTFYIYLAITVVLLAAIFLQLFPAAYVDGQGITLFKKTSEGLVILLFVGAFIRLYARRRKFDTRIFELLAWSIIFTIMFELLFTFYSGSYDFVNMAGHLLEIASFYLIYLAVIETGLKKPYRLLFKELKDSEVAYRESEQKFRAIFENAGVGIVMADLTGRPVVINDKFKEIIGYSDEELAKMEFPEFTHPDDIILDKDNFDKMKLGLRDTYELEKRYIKKDGNILWADISVTLIKDAKGKPQYTLGVIRDTSKRKSAEDEISKLAKFPEENPYPILRIDQKGIITYANSSGKEMLEFWKSSVGRAAPGRWKAIIKHALETNLKEEAVEKYGGRIISFVVAPLKDFGYANLYGRDITRAIEIDKAKTEFVSLASHQLRTPLSSISLASELLLRGVGGEVEEKQKKYLEEIYHSTQRMADLINALLNISRIELGTFVIKPVPMDLAKNINRLLDELTLQVNEKKLNLIRSFKQIPIVEFDENVFRLITENLLTNAIRYTPGGGLITVKLEKNTGCGIPLSAQDKVFDKLYRAENAKEINSEGTGLGLYVVKSVAEKVGAKIWFESKKGNGTTFYVSIPLKATVVVS